MKFLLLLIPTLLFGQISDPTEIDSLKGWFSDSTGGAPLEWRNKLADGHDFDGTVCTDCDGSPTVISGELNGHDVIRFDRSQFTAGADEANWYFTHNDSNTIFMVFRAFADTAGWDESNPSTDSIQSFLGSDRISVDNTGISVLVRNNVGRDSTFVYRVRNGSGTSFIEITSDDAVKYDSTWQTFAFRMTPDRSGEDGFLWIDGVKVDSVDQSGSVPAGSSIDSFTTGRSTGTNDHFWNGEFALLLLYNRDLTDSEVEDVFNWIDTTYFPTFAGNPRRRGLLR